MGTSGNVQSRAEEVSALMDGEVSAREFEHILHEISEDPDLKGCWTRYHLVRDVLQQTLPPLGGSDLPERVSAALKSEPYYLLRHRFRHLSWSPWKRVGAMAAAVATITFLAVLTFPSHQSSVLPPQASISPSTVIWVADQEQRFPTVETDDRSEYPTHQAELDPYLVNHSEYLAGNGMGNVVPFIHVVSYGE
ncbi:sigma-E factor negative regulatory protein RseA [Gammaproteobacteria bacterium]